jgi:hypothetical protein
MSEFQRYEFITIDRPLTKTRLDEVKKLSSHIKASSTHALIEYHYGSFKHDPTTAETGDQFEAWIKLLPPNRRDDYLIRLTRNEPGLSSLLVKDLRALNPESITVSEKDQYITYARLNAESKKIRENKKNL